MDEIGQYITTKKRIKKCPNHAQCFCRNWCCPAGWIEVWVYSRKYSGVHFNVKIGRYLYKHGHSVVERTRYKTWFYMEPTPVKNRYHMMTSSNGNIFRVIGPLCGEFTGHRWIPRKKVNDAELWFFFLSAPWINGWVKLVIWNAVEPIMTSLWWEQISGSPVTTSWRGNAFRITGSLWRGAMDYPWIPLTVSHFWCLLCC